MNIHELISPIQTVDSKRKKNRQKLRCKIFRIFFRLKPAPGHGLSENATLSHTALVSWKTIRVGQTDGQTDGRTDGRRANFLERYVFDNHPFGVDNFVLCFIFVFYTVYTVISIILV